MSLMPKLSTILLLSASVFAASDADVVAFLKKGIGNNPAVSNLSIEINGKKTVPATNGWQAYFVTIEADIKQGNEKRRISQNGTYFVNGDMFAPELVDLKTGTRYNDTLAPDFNASFYTKSNRILGEANATHKIAIFSDPLCPFCRRYVPGALSYMSKYPKTFAVYYYHLPLAGLHPASVTLTKAAIAAEEEGMSDAVKKLYEIDIDANIKDDQKILDVFNKATGAKISIADINRPSVLKQFEFDQKVAKAMMVSGTPTVFFNGEKDPKKMKYADVKVK